MSSPDARSGRVASRARGVSRRAVIRSLVGLSAAGLLTAGCGNGGFHPLYGATASGQPLDERLAQIDYAPIPGRVGQRIRNELIFQSTGGGSPLPPTHRLEMAIRESVVSTLVKTDGEALSQVYNLDATFKLVNLKTKAVVLNGNSYARASFERNRSIFSNVRAREDAENRAARTLAEELRTRLAAFMSSAA